jgi:hypothetical protein
VIIHVSFIRHAPDGSAAIHRQKRGVVMLNHLDNELDSRQFKIAWRTFILSSNVFYDV